MTLERDPIGRKAYMYWSSNLLTAVDDGTIGTWLAHAATYVALDIYDETDDVGTEFDDITTRRKAAGGFRAQKPILRNGEITFDFSWETNATIAADEFVQALIDAAMDRSASSLHTNGQIAIAALDYAYDDPDLASVEQVQGPVGNWYVSFTRGMPIAGATRGSARLIAAGLNTWYVSPES